jgi:hypothetical protein
MTTTEQECPVKTFAPWASDRERSLRVRIHKAQIVAMARASSEHNSLARDLYSIAAELALEWVFRRVEDVELLERVLRALCQLFLAADNILQVDRQ